jgi:hypothetical protein
LTQPSITRSRDAGITLFALGREATPAAFVAAFRELLSDPTPHVLWDLRECSLSRLSHDQLRWLVSQLMRSDFRKRPGGRTALVCSGDDDENVMRLLVAYAEANDYPIDLAVFRDTGPARLWLADVPSDRPE